MHRVSTRRLLGELAQSAKKETVRLRAIELMMILDGALKDAGQTTTESGQQKQTDTLSTLIEEDNDTRTSSVTAL
jgi:hypothetical protein